MVKQLTIFCQVWLNIEQLRRQLAARYWEFEWVICYSTISVSAELLEILSGHIQISDLHKSCIEFYASHEKYYFKKVWDGLSLNC